MCCWLRPRTADTVLICRGIAAKTFIGQKRALFAISCASRNRQNQSVKQMEADWEFEIGGDAPVIEANWKGFVDLCAHPERVSELTECGELPALAEALVRLN